MNRCISSDFVYDLSSLCTGTADNLENSRLSPYVILKITKIIKRNSAKNDKKIAKIFSGKIKNQKHKP